MKNFFLIISLLFICISNSSCTFLQWRETDEELQQKFKESQIDSEISYFKVDSLNLNTRILSVASNEKKINQVFLHGSPSSLSAWQGYYLTNNS